MRRLILVGTAVFIVGLILRFPAHVAYHWFAPDTVRLANVEGTIWNGSAAEADLAGLYASQLDWRFRPAALFSGQLGFDLQVNPAGGFLETRLGIGAGGRLTLDDARGGVALDSLRDYLPLGGISGNVRIDLQHLELENGVPVAADGTVELLGLIAQAVAQQPLGDYRAILNSTDGAISGTLEDVSGMLDIAGSIRLSADRSYVLDGLVAPTAEAPSAMVNQLRILGSPNSRGQRQFRFEGQL